jgi:hypothetical protein
MSLLGNDQRVESKSFLNGEVGVGRDSQIIVEERNSIGRKRKHGNRIVPIDERCGDIEALVADWR